MRHGETGRCHETSWFAPISSSRGISLRIEDGERGKAAQRNVSHETSSRKHPGSGNAGLFQLRWCLRVCAGWRTSVTSARGCLSDFPSPLHRRASVAVVFPPTTSLQVAANPLPRRGRFFPRARAPVSMIPSLGGAAEPFLATVDEPGARDAPLDRARHTHARTNARVFLSRRLEDRGQGDEKERCLRSNGDRGRTARKKEIERGTGGWGLIEGRGKGG